jgi:DMSO/TMAO reductase YedYZ molybdopterin-dependent catalytic subunit
MKLTVTRLLALGMVLLGGARLARSADPLTTADFDRVKQLTRPEEADEAWLKIPWLSSLWEARKEAAKQGKPMLIWEMDGNPLGCT